MSLALVTGGGGFIGSHVVRALVSEGRPVRVLVLPGEDLRNLRGLDVEIAVGDVRDREAVRSLTRGVDVVFHLAAVYALWTREPNLMREVNVEGTRNVLDACLEARVGRVVYTSSIACFGGQGAGNDAVESSPFALGGTGNEYARTKMEAHELAQSYVARGLGVTTVAPCGPIGPGDVGPTPTGRLLLAALRDPWVFGVDSESNLLDVRDMAAAHLLAERRGANGETYLLGAHNVSMLDVARRALAHARMSKPVLGVPFWMAAIAASPYAWFMTRILSRAPLVTPSAVRIARLGLRADCSKAVRELGLVARPIDESIRDAVEWFFAEGYARRPAAALLDAVPAVGSVKADSNDA